MLEIKPAIPSAQIIKFRMARALAGRSIYFAAAYWIDGLLIDTGCAHTSRQLISSLKSLPVQQIVNTHSHEDHIGANAQVYEMTRCDIWAHPDALPILANPRLQKLQLYRRLLWGMPKPSHGAPIGDWVETKHYRFQVIPTPGHSPDHVCLFEPEQGWLFAGDAYIGGRDRSLRQGYDINSIVASLRKLTELPIDYIFAGSGSVRINGVDAIREKIDYLEELGEKIRSLHAQGLTARRIRRRVFGRELPIAYLTLGHFSSLHLVHSYLDKPTSPELANETEDETTSAAETAE